MRSKSPLAGSKYVEPAPSRAIVVRVSAAPRSSATPRSCSQSVLAIRLVTDGSLWSDRVRPVQPASRVAEPPGMDVDIARQRGPFARARQPPERTIGCRHSATDGSAILGRISNLHTRYALKPEVHLVVGLVADRPRSVGSQAGPAHRHRASRPQGTGTCRVRRDVDVTQPPAGLPDRPRPRRGPDDRGHRRQPVPRLRGRDRRELDRPCASRRSSRRSRSRPAS